MARPLKTGLDYFPFDVDLFNDEKVIAIAGEFGLKGEITLIKLLCAVYRNGYFIEWSPVMRLKLRKELPGISAELIDAIINRLVKWGFFDESLFNSEKVLTSRGIQQRYYAVCSSARRKCIIEKYALYDIDRLKSKPKKASQKSMTITDALPIYTPQPKINIIDSIKLLKQDQIWGEPVCMRYDLTSETLYTRLDEFALHCQCQGQNEHDDINHVKRHFCQWLIKQKSNSPVKPASLQPEDYTFRGGFGGQDT